MMNKRTLTIIQCWDDGVTTDARLTNILRRYGAKASFNLNAELHGQERTFGWVHQGTNVHRLGWSEMRSVYDGFVIANHSLTHPHLDQISIEDARCEIEEGRDRLQQFFGQPVLGFAYPFGTYNDAVMNLVRDAGHVYARTVCETERPFPPENAMALHPCCHFLAPDFWSRYEKSKETGVFYFWGHSYEMVTEAMWRSFENLIQRISANPAACWGNIVDQLPSD
jgi:peptidoglycan-N-acetylglucosamine deacetylase